MNLSRVRLASCVFRFQRRALETENIHVFTISRFRADTLSLRYKITQFSRAWCPSLLSNVKGEIFLLILHCRITAFWRHLCSRMDESKAQCHPFTSLTPQVSMFSSFCGRKLECKVKNAVRMRIYCSQLGAVHCELS